MNQYPGFPSLIVGYGGNDLFYSGHTGFTLLIFLYNYENKNKLLTILTLLIFILTITYLPIYGIHYINDIIISIIVSIYLKSNIDKYYYIFYYYILKIYVSIFFIFERKKENGYIQLY